MKSNLRKAFTLVEVLIVVVIMAVLAATIIPQFADSSKDAKESALLFNLHTLRSQIEMYQTQHDGLVPSADLSELITNTDKDGTKDTGAYGPYISEVPENPFSSSSTVKAVTNDPAKDTDVTGTGGWLYNATSGNIWIDHEDYYTE
jgi:general secretion pathway protein G